MGFRNKISAKRYSERKKRAKNRIRIGVTLISLFLLMAIISVFILKTGILFVGIFLLIGLAYGGAGLWELGELKKRAQE